MKDVMGVWERTKAKLAGKLTAATFMIWIKNLEPVSVKGDELILCAPSKHALETVEENYLEDILFCLREVDVSINNVLLITECDRQYFEEPAEKEENAVVVFPKMKENPFISRYTFDNFVVGNSNKFAFVSAKTVAENPGTNDGLLTLNPLFIYGGVGLGKTHLLHSIENYILENNPSLKVLYVPTEKLTNEYFSSLSNYSSDKDAYRNFREKYSSVDVLMLDDVQFLQRKGGLQDIIFHIFNDLYNTGRQIVLCSDRPPREINDIEDRLRSRFEGGLLTDINIPDLETRIAIILKKMEKQKTTLSEDIIYYLAEKMDTNIRELEGALLKVVLYAQLLDKTPTLELAKDALKIEDITKTEELSYNKIIDAVSQYFRVPQNDIISKKKTKNIAEARMIAIYLVCELLSIPLINIGQIFGGRDHTTIIYNRDKIKEGLHQDKKVQIQVKDIKNILNV